MGPADHINSLPSLRGRGVPRLGLDQHRVGQERSAGRDLRKLAGELAIDQVGRPFADQPGGGGIPERGGATVAKYDLVTVGKREQIREAAADAADQIPDWLLAVRGAHQFGPLGQRLEGLRPHLRGATAEAAIGGL